MLGKSWSPRSRVYVFGVLVLPVIAAIVGAVTVDNPSENGNAVVLSAFLAALWAFAGFVVLFNVVELIIRFRTNRPSSRDET